MPLSRRYALQTPQGKLSREQYLKAKHALLEDMADASVINITDEVMCR